MSSVLFPFLALASVGALAPLLRGGEWLAPERRTDWLQAGTSWSMPADAAVVDFPEVHPGALADPDNGPERHEARWDPAETSFINHIAVHSSVSDPKIFANIAPEAPQAPEGTDLPPSLFLSQRPDFWPETLPWPALGPPHFPGENAIPAMLRWSELRRHHP